MASQTSVALVTGAGSGIGRAIALELAQAGWLVYAAMREPQGRNLAKASALPAQVRVVELDVCDDMSGDLCVRRVLAEAGRIDCLVNNAGIMFQGVSEAYDMNQARLIMETNFFSAVRLNRLVLPAMRRQRSGVLVHITSIAGSVVFPYAGLYSASKMATEGLAQSYRHELAGFGIDSLVIQPCPYPSELLGSQQTPNEAERGAAYGDAAHVVGQRIASTRAWHASGKAPDSSEVAQVLNALLALPYGERPFRTVAGNMDFGVRRLNELIAETDDAVFRTFTSNSRKAARS
ncbi:MAG: SDR family NAD(P)-dependent oxidoreductase [Pseudomonadota bacterium]